PPDYQGGIECIDPDTYITSIALDDGDGSSHGYTTAMALISPSHGFFIGAASPTDNCLYHFNPSTGAVEIMAFNAADQYYLQHKHFAGLSGGIGLDQHDRLWIGNITDRRIEIIITTPNQGLYSSDGTMPIPNNSLSEATVPSQIIFCLEPAITDADEALKPSSSGESGNFCFLGAL
ncbi:MAG: hypothetical protein JXA79_09345, partial [Deltaproteobacteria bacterium]|nr:hypothetical protein [Deltaproteobacteria bacterium]